MNDVSRPSDYERSDADPRLIGAIALGTAVFLLLSPWLLNEIYPSAKHSGGIAGPLPQPPPPRLQVRPKSDLERLRADERQRLDGVGWIDRQQQIAHIPIERAMQLLVNRGLPDWPKDQPNNSSGNSPSQSPASTGGAGPPPSR
jgi:hypothetical protein